MALNSRSYQTSKQNLTFIKNKVASKVKTSQSSSNISLLNSFNSIDS